MIHLPPRGFGHPVHTDETAWGYYVCGWEPPDGEAILCTDRIRKVTCESCRVTVDRLLIDGLLSVVGKRGIAYWTHEKAGYAPAWSPWSGPGAEWFNINPASYELWSGNAVSEQATLTLETLTQAIELYRQRY